ncbi:MAG: hypothetical protein K2Y26_05585 [Gemmatimonadaceae bacterium]|nr:hypothetical protein [Gemmatimonadaceae bacterium]
MSKSPRRLLRRAADALRELEDVRARHPEAEAELEAALGREGLAELDAAVAVVRAAADGAAPAP